MVFSFESLDSADFEFLAKDIAERESGIKLTCYTAGRDGGIDADDFYQDSEGIPSVILQAKHMEKTKDVGKLKKQLIKFFDKIVEHGYRDSRIMIFTSMRVTRNKQKEIKEEAAEKGCLHVDVFDEVKVKELLDDPKNQDIIRKHFKLWIAHTEILNQIFNQDQFIDCEQFLVDAENQRNLFVQTGLYDQALRCLENDRLVLIAGDPGTGKTTMTRMLALTSAADGYKIRHSSENDPQRIKQVISADADLKEVIILDDFLGQRNLDVSNSRLNTILILVSYIQRTKSKRIILNSRFTILNEAKNRSDEFMKMIRRIDKSKSITVINSNRLSRLDKARILLSNLRHWAVPPQYISSLTFDMLSGRDSGRSRKTFTSVPKYLEVIEHDNYNPRIIEYICKEEVYSRSSSDYYFDLIQGYLDDPKEIWKDEFDNRMYREDRCVMYVLFSLTDTYVSSDSLREAFQKLAYSDESLDSSRNIFESAIGRLTESLLRKIITKEGVRYSVINPSVNDYISSFLRNADAQVVNIIESAAYADQITRLAKLNESALVSLSAKAIVQNGRMSALPSLKSSTCVQVLEIVNNFKIFDNSVSNDIISAIEALEHNYSHEDSVRMFVRGLQHQDSAVACVRGVKEIGNFVRMPGLKKFFSVNSGFERLLRDNVLDATLIRECYELALRYAVTAEEKEGLLALEYHVICRELASSATAWVEEVIESTSFDTEEFLDVDGVMISELDEACQEMVEQDYRQWREKASVSFDEKALDCISENEIRRIYGESAYYVIDSMDHERLLGISSAHGRSSGLESGVDGEMRQIANLFKEYMDA